MVSGAEGPEGLRAPQTHPVTLQGTAGDTAQLESPWSLLPTRLAVPKGHPQLGTGDSTAPPRQLPAFPAPWCCRMGTELPSLPLLSLSQSLEWNPCNPWACRGCSQPWAQHSGAPRGSGFVPAGHPHRFPVSIMVMLATPSLSSLLPGSGFFSGLPGFQPFPGNKAPVQAPRVFQCRFAT